MTMELLWSLHAYGGHWLSMYLITTDNLHVQRRKTNQLLSRVGKKLQVIEFLSNFQVFYSVRGLCIRSFMVKLSSTNIDLIYRQAGVEKG